MSIVKLLKQKLNRTIFTTPSHNQKPLFSKEYECFYKDDVSEFDGYDNLACPESFILNSQNKTSEIFNTLKTFYIVQGATCAILSAMKALIAPMDRVLVARNCHKSVFNGLILTNAQADWFIPEVDKDWGLYTKIDPKKLDATLKLNDYKVFIMTSPTYEGINSDIAKISKVCKENNTYLIVDEAHGALYNFSEKLPETAIEQGADVSINSLHKTAGALNQTALLHINKNIKNLSVSDFQNAINLFQTTSPSYPLLKNIEQCVMFLNSVKGRKKVEKLIYDICKFKSEMKKSGVEFFEQNHDITKILLKKKGISGSELSNKLFDEFNIEDEMNNEIYCLFLTGIGTTNSKLQKLKNALLKIKSSENNNEIKQDFQPYPLVKLRPPEAFGVKTKIVNKQDSILKISSKMILPYPPGIGILYPGEAIQEWHLDYLEDEVEVIGE